jgi:hypothetical protein
LFSAHVSLGCPVQPWTKIILKFLATSNVAIEPEMAEKLSR